MKKIYVLLSAVLFGAGAFAQGDDCATAVPVTPGTYTADGPSTGGGATNGCFGSGGTNADWYSYTPTCDGNITVTSTNDPSLTDTRLSVYSGNCGALVCEANDDDGGAGFTSTVSNLPVIGGTTYYIEWDDRWSTNGFDWDLIFTSGSQITNAAVSNIGFATADLTWMAAAAETAWIVEYGLAGFTQGSGTQVSVMTTPATSLSGLIPETTYDVYIYDPNDICTATLISFTTNAVCPVPTGITTTPGANDAALAWTAGGTETVWNVEYDAFGFLLGTGNMDAGLNTNSDALTGLMPLTDYQWYVQAVCDLNTADGVDTVSLWVGPNGFTTVASCLEPTALGATVNGFDNADLNWTGGAETEWVIQWGATGFLIGTGTTVNTMTNPTNVAGLMENTSYDYYVAAVCGPGDTSVWAGPITFTTPIACPDVTGVTATPGANDAALAWTAGGTETEWNVEYGVAGFTQGSGTTVNVMTTPSTNLLGLTADTDYEYYVEAVCGGTNGNSTFLGPFTFTTLSTCNAPSGLMANNITPNAADLVWTANGTGVEWEIEYGMNGFTQGMGTSSVTTTNPTNISGLTADTDYCFYVREICGAGDSSLWAGPFCFTTISSCIVPSALGISGLTTSSVDLNWTAGLGETEWMVEYGTTGFAPGSGTSVNVMTTPTTNVTGLMPNTSYEFYVQAICGAGDSSLWVGPYSFTTTISCPQPTNINAINVSTTAANLLWQAGGSETSWNLEWGVAGFMPGDGTAAGSIVTSNNPNFVTGLTFGTTYEFYVQGICGVGDSSTWSGPFAFTTLCGTEMAPYMQDFDATTSVPNCWSTAGAEPWSFNASGAGGPAYGVAGAVDHTSGTGNYTWIDGSGGINSNELVTPLIDFSGLTTPEVGFWILSNNTNDAAQNEVRIEAEVSPGIWSTLVTYSGNNANWTEVSVIIPAAVQTTTSFRLVQTQSATGFSYYNDLLIDDFYVREFVPCVISAGTPTNADLCMTNGAVEMFDAITNYTDSNGVWYFPNATDPGAQSFAASNGSLVLTGLTPGQPFTFDYVVSGCDNDTVSVTVVSQEQPSAGGDGTLTDCNTGDIFLLDGLTGTITTGGAWSSADAAANSAINGNTFEANGVAGNTTYNFDYVVANGSCTDTAVVVVTLNDCLGLDANEVNALEVYPNPVSDVLTIANLNVDGNATITLTDVQGKVVYTKSISNINGNFQLEMSNLENGVYVVNVVSENTTQKVRVVKH